MAPKDEVVEFLKTKALITADAIAKPIDLTTLAESLQQNFGLSRYALEVRLAEIGVPLLNKKYGN